MATVTVGANDATATAATVDKKTIIQYVKKSLTSAQILALNTTNIEIVTAPGAGKLILPIRIVYDFTFVSVVYATNVLMGIKTASGSEGFVFTLSQSSSTIKTESSNIQLDENEAISISVQTGDPTGGDGTMVVYLYYQILTL